MKHSIKELGITLEELYNGDKQINVHLSNKPFSFHIVMKDRIGVDCKLSSWGANLWVRTKKGMEMEKYKTFGGLQRAINVAIKEKIETSNSLIQYSLSDEVYTF